MDKTKLLIILRALRVNQWIKNLVVFTALIFNEALFNGDLFLNALYAFAVLCLLSSASYLLNDIIDYKYDRIHPVKKNRPIAAGTVSIPQATFWSMLLVIVSILLALYFSIEFFLLAMLFILLHFFYSLKLKQYPLIDIFTISASFMIRTAAGQVVTGYHIPIWLFLTIFFGSLFMATVKRHAELVSQGTSTRVSLYRYKEHLLYFLTTTFATSTILGYSFYTYYFVKRFDWIINPVYSPFEDRKWMMITIPFVVYGIARYAQLLYENEQGERPEKIITTDKPLLVTIGLWGAVVITLIYIL